MRIGKLLLLAALLLPLTALAQGPPGDGGPEGLSGGSPKVLIYRGGPMGPGVVTVNPGMGEWWQNSEVAQKLKLSDQQLKKLGNIFYQHRLKLIDYQAAVDKQNLELQNLLDQDNPDEGQVGAQVDRSLAARARLEREFTMMNLALRKVLTVEQWKQLQAIQSEQMPPGGNMFFYRFRGGPGGGCGPEIAAPPPMPPGQ
jgi:Spy/CpxP family protein refolding chaperone